MGKPFFLSSTINPKPGDCRVVDKIPFFFHTREGRDQSITIDLRVPSYISELRITNRTNGCQERSRCLFYCLHADPKPDFQASFPVAIGDDFTSKPGQTSVTKISNKSPRYLTIFSPEHTILHFSSIQVIGKICCEVENQMHENAPLLQEHIIVKNGIESSVYYLKKESPGIAAPSPYLKSLPLPPEEIPSALRDRYTLDGNIPLQKLYFNQTTSVSRTFTLQKYINVLKALANGSFEYYGNTLSFIMAATKDFPLVGKHVCVFGAMNVNCDAIALFSGADKVDILEYNLPVTEHPQVRSISHSEALQNGLQWDSAFSISSFEHDGLGRYGDPLDPDGDLRAMNEACRMLRPGGLLYLSVPVGTDCLVWNAHRIYGNKRLPMLLESWELVKTYGYSENLHNLSLGKYVQPVFVLRKKTVKTAL
jgi:hypothetical protein